MGKGSDYLQLIKFWPSCAPGKGVCSGTKIFGSALLQPARSVCVPSERFFHLFFVFLSVLHRSKRIWQSAAQGNASQSHIKSVHYIRRCAYFTTRNVNVISYVENRYGSHSLLPDRRDNDIANGLRNAQPFLPRDAMRKSAIFAVARRLSVRPSVCHVRAFYPDS